MKLNKFLWSLAVLGLASCSADKLADEPTNPNEVSDGTPKYIAVTIGNTGNSSRAAGDQTEGDPLDSFYDDPTGTGGDGKAHYEEGYGTENDIKTIRFYFFSDEAGTTPVDVTSIGNTATAGTYTTNYLDVTPSGNTVDMPNVERKYNAVLIFHVEDGSVLPQYMVAVANMNSLSAAQKTALSSSTGVTLAQIQAVVDNCSNTNATNGFVMASSVYLNGSTKKNAVATNIFDTQAAAEANPVEIYVERSLAKVRLQNSLVDDDDVNKYNEADVKTATIAGNETKIYPLKNKDGDNEELGSTQIYVAFQGWYVTNETDESYLVKSIDTSWTNDDIFANWTYPAYYRSFWAQNPDPTTYTTWDASTDVYAHLKHYNWNETGVGFHAVENPKSNNNVLYTQENADEGTTKNAKRNTQVLVKALLVDQNGNALTIGEFMGTRYNGTKATKTAIIEYLSSSLNYYRTLATGETTPSETTTTAGTVYRQICADDLDFMTISESTSANTDTDLYIYGHGTSGYKLDNEHRYIVVLKLKTGVEGKGASATWYHKEGENIATGTTIAADVINTALAKIEANVYNSGMTYYFFDINHLGTNARTNKGVVRNHIYNCFIDGVVGLGTPVWDPTEVIVPEKVEDKDSFMAARINVLSWRVVNNHYTLGE